MTAYDTFPLRAPEWGDMREQMGKYGNIKAFDPLPYGRISNPSMILTPHRHAQLLSQWKRYTTTLPDSNP